MSRMKHAVLTALGLFLALAALGFFATVGLAVLSFAILLALIAALAAWALSVHQTHVSSAP